ncbi:BT4734/BF3469 family protein, partial [Caecibacteroides pullorum]
MKFGISNNVKSRVVRECTPELLRQALDSPLVARVCAEIEDALEAVRRGEMSKDDFETLKAARKKMLPVITPHATFRSGRRTNAEAVASGLSMYDVDHIPDPRGYYDEKVRGREAELGIVLAHVTPSTEGLRLLFVIPRAGMAPDEAQRWMSARLGDAAYDGAVKDLARCSFLVPREYVLYLDEERLFGNEELRMKNEESLGNEERKMMNEELPADGENSSFGGEADILHSSLPKFKGIPYSEIIGQWFKLAGGEPVQGERNDKLHRLASHLRYIADNDEALLLQVMPRYGLSEEEMKGLIHSACSAKWYSMPRMLKEALENEERRMKNEESLRNEELRMKNEE